MKALDTGVLLALLEGSVRARDKLRSLRGEELATTEANLLELAYIAAIGPSKSRTARVAALERLRQRLTVLPIDGRSVREATARVTNGGDKLSPTVSAMFGALRAAGCDELLTGDRRLSGSDWGVRVRVVGV